MKFIAFLISTFFLSYINAFSLKSKSIKSENNKTLQNPNCITNKSHVSCILNKNCYWDFKSKNCLNDLCIAGTDTKQCCPKITNNLVCNLSQSCYWNEREKKCLDSICKKSELYKDVSLFIKAHPQFDSQKNSSNKPFDKYSPVCFGKDNCKYYEAQESKCPTSCKFLHIKNNRVCIENDGFDQLNMLYGTAVVKASDS